MGMKDKKLEKWSAIRKREIDRMQEYEGGGSGERPFEGLPEYYVSTEAEAVQFAKNLIAEHHGEPWPGRLWLEAEPMPSYNDRDYLFRIGVRQGSPPRGHYVLQRINCCCNEPPSGFIFCYSAHFGVMRECARVFYGERGWAVSHFPEDIIRVDWDTRKIDASWVGLLHARERV